MPVYILNFQIIDKTIGLRMSEEDELLGTDFVEHGIGQGTDLLLVENPSNTPVHSAVDRCGDKDERTISLRRKSTGGFSFQRTYLFKQRRRTKGGFGGRGSTSIRMTSPSDVFDTADSVGVMETSPIAHMNGGTHIGASSPKSNGIRKKYGSKYGAEYTNEAFEPGETNTAADPNETVVRF
jgi:hypothetical protein